MTRLASLLFIGCSVAYVAGCGGSSPNDAFLPPPVITGADAGQPPPPPSVIRVATTGTPTTTEAGGKATFTVTLSAKPASEVVVPIVSSTDTEIKVEPSALTFGPNDFDQPKTVTLIGQDDAVDDGDQKVKIAIGPSTSSDAAWNGVRADAVEAANADDDTAGLDIGTPTPSSTVTESGATATFTVRLKSQPSAPVTIALTSTVPTEGKADKMQLVFGPNDWQTAQTVTVTGQDDAVADNDVSFDINLAKPQTTDDAYAALSAQKVTFTNLDDDIPGFFVFPPATNQRFTTEAGGTTSFTVRLRSKPTGNVTIPIASSKPAEGTLGSVTQLVFTPANFDQTQTVTVTGVDDKVDDDDQPYKITLGAATSTDALYQGQDPPDVDLTNKDDDTAAILVSAPSGNITTEAGGFVTFTVKLGSQPTAPVTLAIASTKSGEGTADKAQLVFDGTTWNTAQTVKVTGENDLVDDGDQAYTIQITHKTGSITTDPKYAAIEPADVNLTNSDDDTQGVTVSGPRGGTQTTEAGGFVFIDVVLKTKPTGNVTIPVSVSNNEAMTDVTELVFTPTDWDQTHSIKVTGKDDSVDDGDQQFTVVLGTASGGGYTVNPDDVTLTNVDDDTAAIVVSALSGALTELGGQAKFKVRLASRPAGTNQVSIAVTVSNNAEASLAATAPATLPLVFTTANWNVDQEVVVTGKGDGIIDGDSTVNILLAPATSGDAKYAGMDAPDFTSVTNTSACGIGNTNASEGEDCDDANATKCDGCETCTKQSWAKLASGASITANVGAVTAAGASMCIEAWAQIGTGVDGIIASSATSDTDVNFALRCDLATGDLSFGSETTLESLYVTVAGTSCNDGKWHHFSGCRKSAGGAITYRVFLDGNANADSAAGTALAIGTAANITFGAAKSTGTAGLDGAIDEAHLSTTTVRSSSFTPERHPAATANTIALWHFNEGTGTTAKSIPANTYPATHSSASWAIDSGYTAAMCQ